MKKIKNFFRRRPALRLALYECLIGIPLSIMLVFRDELPEKFTGITSPFMIISYMGLVLMVSDIFRKVFNIDDKKE